MLHDALRASPAHYPMARIKSSPITGALPKRSLHPSNNKEISLSIQRHDRKERPMRTSGGSYRPPEGEGDLNRSGQSAAVLCAERVGPQHRCHRTPKDAAARRHHGLIVLQANSKVSPAVGFARVPVRQQPFVVFKFVEVHLKNSRSEGLKENGITFTKRSFLLNINFVLFLFWKEKKKGT